MLRNMGAAVLGYLVLGLVLGTGVLLASLIIGVAPFHSETGDLSGLWMIALLLISLLASTTGGWVCRRLGTSQHAVAMMIVIVLGLMLGTVLAAGAIVGPSATGRSFMEALLGSMPSDLPFGELLEGRPPTWFSIVNAALATVAIVFGASLAKKDPAQSD